LNMFKYYNTHCFLSRATSNMFNLCDKAINVC
jgi:hypothetical protein